MSQIQEAYTLLQQIDKLLADIELKIRNIEGGSAGQPSLKETLVTFRQLESVARRYLIVATRLGFKGNVAESINDMTRLIITFRQAQIAAQMLRAALFVGTGPIGWLMTGAAVGLTAANVVSYGDPVYDSTWGT